MTNLKTRIEKLEETYRPISPFEERPPETLEEFVQSSVAFDLHRWQKVLCGILERLRYEQGVRILLHAPPQFGKSFVVSQRLPAYLLGHNPTTRIALACYNETHSTGFGAVVRDIMSSEDYAQMFPESSVERGVSGSSFFTVPRLALRDAQPSFKAMGLLSGFVGRGCDTLLIDDPYKSAADAFSEQVNIAVWRWWSQTVRPRLRPENNVVMMYHAYHIDDLAERLEKEGGWERYRFPAIADGRLDKGIDPTGREIGEPLSPMRSIDDLEKERAADPQTFAAQFQGIPIADVGGFFNISMIKRFDARPPGIVRMVRAWDIAATSGGGDYTAGVLVGKDGNGAFCILDVILLQGGPDEVDQAILSAAQSDGRNVKIHLPQDPGSAGKRDARTIAKNLAGFMVDIEPISGSKENRARACASQVNVGNFTIVESPAMIRTGPYRGMNVTQALLRMLGGFPHTTAKKDGVDALADAFNALAVRRPKFGLA